jgi:hypothetical protein
MVAAVAPVRLFGERFANGDMDLAPLMPNLVQPQHKNKTVSLVTLKGLETHGE